MLSIEKKRTACRSALFLHCIQFPSVKIFQIVFMLKNYLTLCIIFYIKMYSIILNMLSARFYYYSRLIVLYMSLHMLVEKTTTVLT